jgi:hypothetical protein
MITVVYFLVKAHLGSSPALLGEKSSTSKTDPEKNALFQLTLFALIRAVPAPRPILQVVDAQNNPNKAIANIG